MKTFRHRIRRQVAFAAFTRHAVTTFLAVKEFLHFSCGANIGNGDFLSDKFTSLIFNLDFIWHKLFSLLNMNGESSQRRREAAGLRKKNSIITMLRSRAD